MVAQVAVAFMFLVGFQVCPKIAGAHEICQFGGLPSHFDVPSTAPCSECKRLFKLWAAPAPPSLTLKGRRGYVSQLWPKKTGIHWEGWAFSLKVSAHHQFIWGLCHFLHLSEGGRNLALGFGRWRVSFIWLKTLGLMSISGLRDKTLEQRGQISEQLEWKMTPLLALWRRGEAHHSDLLLTEDWRGLFWATVRYRGQHFGY